jgi:hypothetical protein
VVAARTSTEFVDEVRALLPERDVFRKSAADAVAAAERQFKEAKRVYATAARPIARGPRTTRTPSRSGS